MNTNEKSHSSNNANTLSSNISMNEIINPESHAIRKHDRHTLPSKPSQFQHLSYSASISPVSINDKIFACNSHSISPQSASLSESFYQQPKPSVNTNEVNGFRKKLICQRKFVDTDFTNSGLSLASLDHIETINNMIRS